MWCYCPVAVVPGKAKTAPSRRKEPSRLPKMGITDDYRLTDASSGTGLQHLEPG